VPRVDCYDDVPKPGNGTRPAQWIFVPPDYDHASKKFWVVEGATLARVQEIFGGDLRCLRETLVPPPLATVPSDYVLVVQEVK
jgi:hypothetical protein